MNKQLSQCYLQAYKKDKFDFLGAYCFQTETSEFSFLLNKFGKSIIISKDLLKQIEGQSISEELAIKLYSHGFIEVNGLKHCNACEACLKIALPSVFVIDITKACNLNCVYCFRDLDNNKNINANTLLDICDFIDKTVNDLNLNAISIQLWGGEPLCNMQGIRFVSDYFCGKPYTVQLDIETNATLITESIAAELFKRKISVGISIDGYPNIQNLQRPSLNKTASSKAVEQGVRNLQKIYGNRFGGICVVTKNNYNHIEQILDYFIRELKISSIKFNIVRDNPNAKMDALGLTLDEVRWFSTRLFETIKAYSILGLKISEGNILTKFNNLNESNHSNCCISCGCTGGTRIISFDMEGNIFPCEMTDYQDVKIGNIYSGIDLKTMIKSAINSNSYYSKREKENCAYCPWRYFCRGGCTSRAHYLNMKKSVDETECVLNNVLYPQIIKSILNKEINRVAG